MISRTRIKQRLKDGEKLNGCWLEMFSPIAAEIVALSGYDTALIDLEHGPGSCYQGIQMMQAIALPDREPGCAGLLRTSSSNTADIKRALDTGPEGIMVPDVRSVEEAEHVVAACRYGPAGYRGAAPGIIRGSAYGTRLSDYPAFMEKEFLLIIQIESLEAVNAVDRIAAVDGVDMLFIGPNDLSGTLGELGNYATGSFREAFGRIEQAATSAGKFLGTIPFPGWSAQTLFRSGHQLVISGADSTLLLEAAKADIRVLQAAASS